jgi:hypothetical protein
VADAGKGDDMDNVQTLTPQHDCAVCEHFRRGIAAADARGDGSRAADGRVLLKRHRDTVALDGPWEPVTPASRF